MTALRRLIAAPLTADSFAPFGEVIESAGHTPQWINNGSCARYDDLARIDVNRQEGRILLSLFEAAPRLLPLTVRRLERHPLSSQSFYPLDGRPFLVVVADGAQAPQAAGVRAFLASGIQGVNYRPGTWHHPLIALEQTSRFLVIDRGGPGANCDEADLEQPLEVARG